MSVSRISRVISSTLALAATMPLAASADESATAALEEVVVTAQKRSESLQDVPLSIMAVGGETLEQAGISQALELDRLVPNLRIYRSSQAASVTIRIRGIGASGNSSIDPSVAPFLDGVYITRPGVLLTSFLDVASVEVLRGPQGTLFGRNASVGALQINSNVPELGESSTELTAEVGNYDLWRLQGIVNVPVGDRFALRLAGLADDRSGYIENRLDGRTYGDRDTQVARLSGKWDISDGLTWIGRVDYSSLGGDGIIVSEVDSSTATAQQLAAFTARLGGPQNAPDYGDPTDQVVRQHYTGDIDDSQWGVTSDLNWELESGYAFRLIDAYRDWRNRQNDGDVVYTPLSLVTRSGGYDSESQSHELQFISPQDELLGGRFDFVAGLYYFQEDYDLTEYLNLGSDFCTGLVGSLAPPLVSPCRAGPQQSATQLNYAQDAESMAVYAQGTIALTDTLDLTLGGRWTSDDKSGDFVQTTPNPVAAILRLRVPEVTSLDFSDDQFTYRANLSWNVSDDKMLFIGYSTGYKSGGINSSGGAQALGDDRLFDSETVSNLEVGAKTLWMSNALMLNATLYRMDIDDFQDRAFDGVSFLIRNAGSLRQQGVEIETQARPMERLRLDLSLAYTDSEFTDYEGASGLPGCTGAANSCPLVQDLKGEPAPYSPEWQATLGAQYEGLFSNGWGWTLRGDVMYTDDQYIGQVTDANPQSIQPSYALLGARYTVHGADDGWSVSLWGQNLTDEGYAVSKFYQTLDNVFGVRVPATGATLLRSNVGDPRTFGLSMTLRF
jgi:iron complex outermembrane receptor protein